MRDSVSTVRIIRK